MKKVYIYKSADSSIPFEEFMSRQDKKMRKKLEYGIKCIAMFPDFMTEPHVKHFSIERYNRLYEYRERIKVMVRIIFAFDKNDDIILLCPFIKKQERNTMQSLEQSVKLLAEIDSNPQCLIEYRGGILE